jgi:hypothetical protein
MNVEEKMEMVRDMVSEFMVENDNLIPIQYRLNPEDISHIKNIAKSILCTKWKVGYHGGSFVQAIVDNDLNGAYSRADSVNRDCILFYVSMMRNVGKPLCFLD